MAAATAAVAHTLKRREESKAKTLNAEQATVIAVDFLRRLGNKHKLKPKSCLLYTSDAADDSLRVDLGGRRIIKKTK